MKIEGTKRRQCIIYLLIDSSGSMDGEKIESVNYAIPDVLDSIKQLNDDNPEAEIKVAIMTFATDWNWVTPIPQKPEDLKISWSDLKASGCTSLGKACDELDRVMHRVESGGFHDDSAGALKPGVIFITDGMPTDNYQSALDKLKKNHWFSRAFKYCLACGDDFESEENQEVFVDLVGNKELIHLISDDNAMKLGDYIKVVTATISKSVSTIDAVEQNENINTSDIETINEQVTSIDDLIEE